ncbi:hypothetical protein [Streptomyces sp. NPDC005423]|uniref:hypothetical protein n=1 Tax=Streptomyces sp. NPDC005423 TaxID=3155343 RepID=UPI00339E4035
MYGHGYTQPVKPPPPAGLLVLLRVLFLGIAVFSIGFMAWAPLLRLAIVTRKSLDWGLFVAAMAADVLSIVLLGSEPGEDVRTAGGYLGITLLLGTLAVGSVYYLAADIRHFHQLRYPAYPVGQPRAAAYGYPQAPTPVPAPYTAPNPRQTPPPMPRTPAPQPPANTPPPRPPQRPAPARIDQVRAELDELSDYLRKHDEGGR